MGNLIYGAMESVMILNASPMFFVAAVLILLGLASIIYVMNAKHKA